MTTDQALIDQHRADARKVLQELGLEENEHVRLRSCSGHNSSILMPCMGPDGRTFLLKYAVEPADSRFYPPEVRLEDYPRREAGFYRYLDTVDPNRHRIHAPKTILIDSQDPPRWLLLEWIGGAVGPAEEWLGMDEFLNVLRELREIPLDQLLGRRHFPLNHWDVVSYRDRIRLMVDPMHDVIGADRWQSQMRVLLEAQRWLESRPVTVVHGDFTEQNVLVDAEGRPFLIDFERIGIGNEDHDFAFLWAHSERNEAWKRDLVSRYLDQRHGSDRIKAEWGIRSALIYLAMRRLRFAHLVHGEADPNREQNLALLDAALQGGPALFPI
ncbi:MAG: aminoglycoside phosphotransferase family protein [Planctomycetota bacterium]